MHQCTSELLESYLSKGRQDTDETDDARDEVLETHLGAGRQQIYEADEILEVIEAHLHRQYLLAALTRLIHDERQLVVVLHYVLHDIRLIAFERQAESFDLDDDVEKVEELGAVLLEDANEVDDRLYLLRKDLQTRALVSDERLNNNDKYKTSRVTKQNDLSSKEM